MSLKLGKKRSAGKRSRKVRTNQLETMINDIEMGKYKKGETCNRMEAKFTKQCPKLTVKTNASDFFRRKEIAKFQALKRSKKTNQ